MVKEQLFVSMFETFIKETSNGKRRKLNGERIKPQSIKNYVSVLKLVRAYEQFYGRPVIVKSNIGNNVKHLQQERTYWKNFYRNFSDYLFSEKRCHDNFTGAAFKIIKSVFSYFKNEKFLQIQDFYHRFYIREEVIDIVTLLPEQLCFLIMDKNFEAALSKKLQRFKDCFVFGCTAALRYSDLMSICVKDVTNHPHGFFLHFKSVKTGADVNIKLPDFAVAIFNKYALNKDPRRRLFRKTILTRFNEYLKELGYLAGWNNLVGKYRSTNGVAEEIKTPSGKLFRFSDLLTSHVMRRTGITVLLMLEMPETLVRKISGHTANSKSFFRYVNFAQSYITSAIDNAHQKLISLYNTK